MEIEERPSYYAILPAHVRYDKRLKPMERLLYAEITALSNKYGYCTATNGYFARLYDAAKETVSRWISNLVSLGYLSIDMVYDGKQIKYRKIRIDEKVMHPIDEKVKDNIINNNITRNNILSISENEEAEKVADAKATANQKQRKSDNADPESECNKKRFEAVAEIFNRVFADCQAVRKVSLKSVAQNKQRRKHIPEAWKIAKDRVMSGWVDKDGLIDGEPVSSKHLLEWFEAYFEQCREDSFINGTQKRSEAHRNWKPDLENLLRRSEMEKRVYEN